ncbi:PilW family protein [Spartinivicinus poritis]|uniref:PilW family protein n=1 Tax=Spartinivicinus poritis TaxID=2994640 RepID=A0ABT5U2E8_9GAMM|nr:PilW family protein [Spartinivicinus sp. A2-2]MDE1460534.1 PilW family protein [Spartinivicinus sp. A2-2]
MHFYKQQGMSLIELMIALVLGLLLIAGILQLFLGVTQTFRQNETLSRIQENGRFSLDFIAQDIRSAGYQEPGKRDAIPFFLKDCLKPGSTTANLANCTNDLLTVEGNDPANNSSDRLSVFFEPTDQLDCAGADIRDPSNTSANQTVVNIYFIDGDDLSCSSYSPSREVNITNNQALLSGVQSMQVLYGVRDSDDNTQYLSADKIGSDMWQNIRTVKIGVLVNSGEEKPAVGPQNTYKVLGKEIKLNGGTQRHIYTTTVRINNAI